MTNLKKEESKILQKLLSEHEEEEIRYLGLAELARRKAGEIRKILSKTQQESTLDLRNDENFSTLEVIDETPIQDEDLEQGIIDLFELMKLTTAPVSVIAKIKSVEEKTILECLENSSEFVRQHNGSWGLKRQIKTAIGGTQEKLIAPVELGKKIESNGKNSVVATVIPPETKQKEDKRKEPQNVEKSFQLKGLDLFLYWYPDNPILRKSTSLVGIIKNVFEENPDEKFDSYSILTSFVPEAEFKSVPLRVQRVLKYRVSNTLTSQRKRKDCNWEKVKTGTYKYKNPE